MPVKVGRFSVVAYSGRHPRKWASASTEMGVLHRPLWGSGIHRRYARPTCSATRTQGMDLGGSRRVHWRYKARERRFAMATFGCDSNTASNPCGNGVYFLPLGQETTPHGSLPTPPAGATVLVYWNIGGPGNAPSGTSPTAWGQDQALVFTDAYNSYGASGTPFGSISLNTGGWPETTANENADAAFINTIIDGLTNPGTYLNQNISDNYLPSGYPFNSRTVLRRAARYSTEPTSCSTVVTD